MDNTELIIKTFEKSIGEAVCSVHKFDNVPNNQVFRVVTKSQDYIFKIYAKRDWPEDGKLSFVNKNTKMITTLGFVV